ncbi:hypothetical protein BWI97_16115 [Siphonobacter sp. BAB-5405]|nr:hypothetical protein BWI97_16115 [Siphonobacter sp. BAB-5405]
MRGMGASRPVGTAYQLCVRSTYYGQPVPLPLLGLSYQNGKRKTENGKRKTQNRSGYRSKL